MNCRFALSDGAYVVGALAPEERHAFEQHLAGCAECSRSVRDLAGLPGLLSRVDPALLDEARATPPPPDLLPGLLRTAHRRSRRRLVATGLTSAAAAAALVGVVTLDLRSGPENPPAAQPSAAATSSAPALRMRPVGQREVTAAVSLATVDWGTRLELTCRYRDAAAATASPGRESYAGPAGVGYALVVHTRAGTDERVATWRALPGRTMRLAAATATARSDIATVEVRTTTGRTVLRTALDG